MVRTAHGTNSPWYEKSRHQIFNWLRACVYTTYSRNYLAVGTISPAVHKLPNITLSKPNNGQEVNFFTCKFQLQ